MSNWKHFISGSFLPISANDTDDIPKHLTTSNVDMPSNFSPNIDYLRSSSQPSIQTHVPISFRPQRIRNPPKYLGDYVCHCVLNDISVNPSSSYSHNALYTFYEPLNYDEACTLPNWKMAMQNEFDELIANDTWDIVPLPEGKKAIGGSVFTKSITKVME